LNRGAGISKGSVETVRPGRVFLIAGEASADLHGANLVRAIRDLDSGISFRGIGGPRMAAAGVDIFVSSSDMAVVGLTEVLPRAARIRGVSRRLKSILKTDPPDLLILMDYPEFNLYMARHARRLGIPVLYYISPQVWAWRRGRIRKIARRVDRMAVILPFEEPLYRSTGMPVTYVGHPLLDAVPLEGGREAALEELGIRNEGPVLGILPGSRNEEVDNLLPAMLRAAEILQGVYPGLCCVLPVASTVSFDRIASRVRETSVQVILWHKDMHRVLPGCDVALVASGTATLETAIHGVPMIITYRVSPLSYWIGRTVVRVPFIGLVNLVAGRDIVPEVIQDEVTPFRLAREAARLLADSHARKNMVKDLREVKAQLGSRGASEKTAAIALKMMGR
jgi:lipid-A-disaccharide synthase